MIGTLEAGQLALNVLQRKRQRLAALQLAFELAHLRPCGQESALGLFEGCLLRLRTGRIVDHSQQRLLVIASQGRDLPLAEQPYWESLRCDGLTC